MKSILITGVSGLLASKMADWIIENQSKYKVIGIDNLSVGYQKNLSDKIIFYQMELSTDYLEPIFEQHQVEFVYHFDANAEGLTKMWGWAQEQLQRDRFKWEDYDLNRGIYQYWT